MARKVTVTRFTVEGEGDFPLDMLRYDSCHPASEEDARRAERGAYPTLRGNSRRVRLERVNVGDWPGPTFERWASFGWDVVEVEGRVVA